MFLLAKGKWGEFVCTVKSKCDVGQFLKAPMKNTKKQTRQCWWLTWCPRCPSWRRTRRPRPSPSAPSRAAPACTRPSSCAALLSTNNQSWGHSSFTSSVSLQNFAIRVASSKCRGWRGPDPGIHLAAGSPPPDLTTAGTDIARSRCSGLTFHLMSVTAEARWSMLLVHCAAFANIVFVYFWKIFKLTARQPLHLQHRGCLTVTVSVGNTYFYIYNIYCYVYYMIYFIISYINIFQCWGPTNRGSPHQSAASVAV